ncbi:DUF3300 domain-containing protein [Geomonas sp. Red69]|uniref:DUF3300 domain-containing protein n=1 Tax=Geomonas diazotrophica TaxID=2843197 RepID=UPI001C1278A3|nr:DUF3300 domain-containing protein [Geomonas diazotrophica]MBU5637133.1 DUF3300 domain-containing protein [Geomonas diazotrophica]
MKRLLTILFMTVLIPITVTAVPVQAQSEPGYYQMSDQDNYAGDDLLYPEELDDLLGPIALYPDPLIAQILPAATFVDQIHDAANFVRLYGDTPRIDYQPWDISVRAVAHYPQVLYMMDREYQWTASLGQAYIEQPQDVMDAIQRLRRFAYDQGNLFSTQQQQVFFEGDIIRIVPARPQYVYVPVYDPTVVYVERYYPSSPFITFSVGFSIGPWLNRDFNWREHRVYYHGWRGGGWITRSRPYAQDRRGVYINKRAATITINERVVQRDTRRYRDQLRVESRRHRDEGKMPPVRLEPRRPGRVEQPRPGKVEQQPRPGKVEQLRPGKIEQPRPGSERRREPWNRREPAPAPGVPAPTTAPPKPGAPPPAAQRQPAPLQPRVDKVQPPAPTNKPQPQGKPDKQRPPGQPKQQPQLQPGAQQAPAVTGEPATARPGRGEGRRREPRPVNRPDVQPPAAATAPAPAARGAAPHAPVAEPAVKAPAAAPVTPAAPAAPARPVTPRSEKPRVAPTPAATSAPKAEPAEPARPAREYEPGQGRGRGESSGGRALQRDEDR